MAHKPLKGIILSPVVSIPSFSGNSSRVNQLFTMLEHFGCDMTFILYRSGVITDNKVENKMEAALGDKFIQLNDELYRGCYKQKTLNFFKRNFGGKYIESVDDYMFPDSFVSFEAANNLQKIIDKNKPDFIVVEYAVLSKFIGLVNFSGITIVDTHDKFTDRNKRIRAEGGEGLWFNLSAQQEKELLARFQYVLAIQPNEHNFFAQLLEDEATEVVTASILEPSKRISYIEENSQWIGFIGSNNHHNFEGLRLFLENHWLAIIAAVPGAKLKVAGAVFSGLDKWLQHGVEFIGRVEDLSTFYDQCSFFINPCMTGSGLKIKSVEALTYSKALVTTKEGTEGLEGAEKYGLYNYSIHDEGYRTICIELLQDESLRRDKGLLNATFINNEFKQSEQRLQNILKLPKTN